MLYSSMHNLFALLGRKAPLSLAHLSRPYITFMRCLDVKPLSLTHSYGLPGSSNNNPKVWNKKKIIVASDLVQVISYCFRCQVYSKFQYYTNYRLTHTFFVGKKYI